MTKEEQMEATIAALQEELRLVRKANRVMQDEMQGKGMSNELRRLRAKIAEWEGSMPIINGGYYHGDRLIRPYLDLEDGR